MVTTSSPHLSSSGIEASKEKSKNKEKKKSKKRPAEVRFGMQSRL